MMLYPSPSVGSRRSFTCWSDVQAYEAGRKAHAEGGERPPCPTAGWLGWQDAECEKRAAEVEGFAS